MPVLLISLLLVGVASLFYINMNSMILGLNDKNEIVVHLNVGTPDDEVKKAEEDLRKIPNVDKITFISKEEALVRQRASLTSAEKIFNDYIGDDASFMPDGFSVTVKNNDIIADTTAEINAMPVVQKAQSSLQVADSLKNSEE